MAGLPPAAGELGGCVSHPANLSPRPCGGTPAKIAPGMRRPTVGGCRHTSAMAEPFLGSEALAARAVNRLRAAESVCRPAQRRVRVARDAELTRSVAGQSACWLRSRAAASSPASPRLPCMVPSGSTRSCQQRSSTPIAGQLRGVQVWEERIETDEVVVVDSMRVTDTSSNGFRSGRGVTRRMSRSLRSMPSSQATEVKLADMNPLVDRYRGRRGIKAARATLGRVDGGAQSPKETWLRLLLLSAGFPRPQTQIGVRNEWGWPEAYLDMGWEDIKVAVEYDGDQHRSSRAQYVKDIRRFEMLERMGWLVVRVVADEDHRDDIIRRVGLRHERGECNATAESQARSRNGVTLADQSFVRSAAAG